MLYRYRLGSTRCWIYDEKRREFTANS